MIVKSAVLVTWTVATWALLVFWSESPWTTVALCFSMAFAIAGIGFGVQHDGSHGAYSKRKWVNRLAASALDAIGGSSYVWRFKHNVLHHTYTNVEGVDVDLEAGGFLRLRYGVPRKPIHRFQHLYFWFFYGFLPAKWLFFDDFKNIANGKLGTSPFPRPKGWDLGRLLAGKVFFFGWSLAVPLAVGHNVAALVGAWFLSSFVLGIALAIVFQLAHCVTEARLFDVPAPGDPFEYSFAEHQVRTTVDFAPGSRFLSWYLGGLNFQREHHLMPKIGHRHYPKLAAIVDQLCRERGIPIVTNKRFFGALASHLRYLRQLGTTDAAAVATDHDDEQPALAA